MIRDLLALTAIGTSAFYDDLDVPGGNMRVTELEILIPLNEDIQIAEQAGWTYHYSEAYA